MRKLNYIFTELISHIFMKLFLVIIISIVSLCSIQFFQALLEFRDNTEMLNKSISQNSSFRLIDASIDSISNKNIAQIVESAEEIFETDAYYFLDNPGIVANKSQNLIPIEGNPPLFDENGTELIMPNLATMNQALMEKIDLTTSEGTLLSESDFSGETNGVLLGAAYKDIYKIGDDITLETITGGTEDNIPITFEKKYEVRGILPENFEMLNYWQGSTDTLSVDEMIILPLTREQLLSDESSLDVQVLGFFFLVPSEVNEELSYLEISEKFREIGKQNGYQYLRVQNDRALYNMAIQSYEMEYQNKLYILGLLLIFSLIQLGIIIAFTFKKRQAVYEIYFSIGSSKRELFTVLVGEYILLFIVGFALLFLVNNFYLHEIWDARAQLFGLLFYFISFMAVAITIIAVKLFKNGRYFRRKI